MILISYRLLKVTLAHGCFSRFSNRTKYNKSHRASQLKSKLQKNSWKTLGEIDSRKKSKKHQNSIFSLHMDFICTSYELFGSFTGK